MGDLGNLACGWLQCSRQGEFNESHKAVLFPRSDAPKLLHECTRLY